MTEQGTTAELKKLSLKYCDALLEIRKLTAEAEVKQGIINGLVVENAQLRERREDQKVLIHSLIEDNTLLTSENKRLRAMLTNAMDTEWLEDSGDE